MAPVHMLLKALLQSTLKPGCLTPRRCAITAGPLEQNDSEVLEEDRAPREGLYFSQELEIHSPHAGEDEGLGLQALAKSQNQTCSEQAKYRAGWNVEPHSGREGLGAGRGLEAGKFGGTQLPLRKPLHTLFLAMQGSHWTRLPWAGAPRTTSQCSLGYGSNLRTNHV